MTYNPIRIFNKDPESEEMVINEGLVQLNLDLIGQETNAIRDQIEALKNTTEESKKEAERSSQNFTHNFLFLGY